MSASRRTFLHGLAGLPLIGGGVTVLCRPTASAAPVTEQLLDTYTEWMRCELVDLTVERMLGGWRDRPVFGTAACDYHRPPTPDYRRTADWQPASARAAVVLAAVGCDWREGRR